MNLKKRMAVVLLSAICVSTMAACSKADKAADDVAYLRQQKEKEVAEKAAAAKAFEAEQARLREKFKQPLP